jgi:tetratricopeptide (TPR) repeat protein
VDQVDGNLDEGDRKLEESLRISLAGGFKDTIAQNHSWLGAHANWRGEFRRSIALSRDAQQAAMEIHDGFQELFALAFLCLAHIGLGEYAEALAVIQEGMVKARERDNRFILGRLTNSLGWLHQELGDFSRAVEYDRESVELGRLARNPNVEISAALNLGFDYLNLGDPPQALATLEEMLVRVDKFAFGAHRWRWAIHLRAYIAEALLGSREPERALTEAETALVQARATGSMKYVGRCHAIRGAIAAAAGDRDRAAADLAEALRIARSISYPTLTWQAAHSLARIRSEQGRPDDAAAAARLALETIDRVAARASQIGLGQTFLGWSRVQVARGDLERLVDG